MPNEVATTKPPANAIVTLGNQVREIVNGTPLEKDAMIIAAMFQSGYFSDIQSVSQAITRALIGQTMGLSAIKSMNNIYITPDGKIAMEAEAIKSIYSGAGFSTRTISLTNEGCVLEWSKGDKILGESEFTKDDAIVAEYIDPECVEFPLKHNVRKITKYKKGGGSYTIEGCNCKSNYKHHPKDMFLARAITRGSRMFADEAFGGNTVYARDEIEDIGQTVSVPSQVTPDTTDEKPKKEIKSFVKAQDTPEAEVVPESEPEQEQPTETPADTTAKDEADERQSIIESIKSAAEILNLEPKEVQQIAQEVSGKADVSKLTTQELADVSDYLDEMGRQEVARNEESGLSQTELGAVQQVFPGAKPVNSKK